MEFIQLTPNNFEEVLKFIGKPYEDQVVDEDGNLNPYPIGIVAPSEEGTAIVLVGNYIIKTGDEFKVVTEEEFIDKYKWE